MAHASTRCPFCGNESISMSSTVLARKRRLMHIKREHPSESFTDELLRRNGEDFEA